jgi:hypothetical protein
MRPSSLPELDSAHNEITDFGFSDQMKAGGGVESKCAGGVPEVLIESTVVDLRFE